jgi:hypothetical protein
MCSNLVIYSLISYIQRSLDLRSLFISDVHTRAVYAHVCIYVAYVGL